MIQRNFRGTWNFKFSLKCYYRFFHSSFEYTQYHSYRSNMWKRKTICQRTQLSSQFRSQPLINQFPSGKGLCKNSFYCVCVSCHQVVRSRFTAAIAICMYIYIDRQCQNNHIVYCLGQRFPSLKNLMSPLSRTPAKSRGPPLGEKSIMMDRSPMMTAGRT